MVAPAANLCWRINLRLCVHPRQTELSEAVGADLNVMGRDAGRMREGGPFVFAQVKNGVGVPDIVKHILLAWEGATGGRQSPSKRTRTQ